MEVGGEKWCERKERKTYRCEPLVLFELKSELVDLGLKLVLEEERKFVNVYDDVAPVSRF